MQYVEIQTLSDSTNFGNATNQYSMVSTSNRSRGLIAFNTSLYYITISTLGDAVNFGSTIPISGGNRYLCGTAADTDNKGLFIGGSGNSTMVYFNIDVPGSDAVTWGDVNYYSITLNQSGNKTIYEVAKGNIVG